MRHKGEEKYNLKISFNQANKQTNKQKKNNWSLKSAHVTGYRQAEWEDIQPSFIAFISVLNISCLCFGLMFNSAFLCRTEEISTAGTKKAFIPFSHVLCDIEITLYVPYSNKKNLFPNESTFLQKARFVISSISSFFFFFF